MALTAALPGMASKIASAGSAVAVPLAVAYAAYKAAEAANTGLSVLGGVVSAMGGGTGAEALSNMYGETVFDKPAQVMAGLKKGTDMAFSFAKGRVPLGKDALMSVAEFAYAEEGWKKQRERRSKQEFGGALGTIIQHMTDYGK